MKQLFLLIFITVTPGYAQTLDQEMSSKDCSVVFREEVFLPRYQTTLTLGQITVTAKYPADKMRRIPQGTRLLISHFEFKKAYFQHDQIQSLYIPEKIDAQHTKYLDPQDMSAKQIEQFSNGKLTISCQDSEIIDIDSSDV